MVHLRLGYYLGLYGTYAPKAWDLNMGGISKYRYFYKNLCKFYRPICYPKNC